MGRKSAAKTAARANRAAKAAERAEHGTTQQYPTTAKEIADAATEMAKVIEEYDGDPMDAIPAKDIELAGVDFFKNYLSLNFVRLNPLDAAGNLVQNYRKSCAALVVLSNMSKMAEIGAITCARVTEIVQGIRANAVRYSYLYTAIASAVLEASGAGLSEMIQIAAEDERARVQSTRFGEHFKRDTILIKACEAAQERWAENDDNYAVRLYQYITDLRASNVVIYDELKKCRNLAVSVFGDEARQCINIGIYGDDETPEPRREPPEPRREPTELKQEPTELKQEPPSL